MSGILNIAALQRAAEKYDPTLRKLPFFVLGETLDALKINLLEVDGKDKRIVFERRGGLAKPYVVGSENQTTEDEVGKTYERELEPKPAYTAIKDHIMNYREKKVITTQPKVDNKRKDHPLELEIVSAKVTTVGEDIIDALFHAERDNTDKSPLGMFDGFNTIIDNEIAGGAIAANKGNLKTTGLIETPEDEDDIDAFNILIDFIRSANPFLRRRGNLYITEDSLWHCMDALGNKLKYKNAMEYEVFLNHLRAIAKAPGLNIISEPALGTGGRLMLTTPGNLDFGVGTRGEEQFCQIRSPYEDPNLVQFWMQWDAGARVTVLHPKEFLVNEQTNESAELSGDYNVAPGDSL